MPLFQVNYMDPRKSPAMASPMAYQQTDALLADMEAQAQGLEIEQQRFDMAKEAALQQAAHWQNMDTLNTRGMDLREQAQTFEMEQARQQNEIMLADMRRRDPGLWKYLESRGVLGKDAKNIPWDNAGAQLMLQDFEGQYAYDGAQQTHWRMAQLADELGMGDEFTARIQAGEEPSKVYRDVGNLNRARQDDQAREASRQRIHERQRAKLDAMADLLEPEVIDQVEDLLDQLTIEGLDREEINDIQEQIRGFIDPKLLRQQLQLQAEENQRLKQQIIQAANTAGVVGALSSQGLGRKAPMPESPEGARSIADILKDEDAYIEAKVRHKTPDVPAPSLIANQLLDQLEQTVHLSEEEQERAIRQWAADNGIAQDSALESEISKAFDRLKKKQARDNDPILHAGKAVKGYLEDALGPRPEAGDVGNPKPSTAKKYHSSRFPTRGSR